MGTMLSFTLVGDRAMTRPTTFFVLCFFSAVVVGQTTKPTYEQLLLENYTLRAENQREVSNRSVEETDCGTHARAGRRCQARSSSNATTTKPTKIWNSPSEIAAKIRRTFEDLMFEG